MEKIEKLYTCLDDSTMILMDVLNKNYIDSLFISSRNILADDLVLKNIPTATVAELKTIYHKIDNLEMTKEEIRQAVSFNIMKAFKTDNIKNSEFTPDIACLIIAYVAQAIYKDYQTKKFGLLDPCVGSANLLTCVMNYLENKAINAFGFDIVSNSIKLGQVTSDLQGNKVNFVIEDFIESNISGFDLAVFDSSLYIYNDEYFPHVLVNHLADTVKKGAYIIGLIPNDFFEVSGDIKKQILEKCNLVGLITMDEKMFVDKKIAKSILILQRKKRSDEKIKDFLIAALPKADDKQGFKNVIKRIDDYFEDKKY